VRNGAGLDDQLMSFSIRAIGGDSQLTRARGSPVPALENAAQPDRQRQARQLRASGG
jgi:hypothetical protein